MEKNLSINKDRANVYIYNAEGQTIKEEQIYCVDVPTLLQMAAFMSEMVERDGFIEVEYWNGIYTEAKHFRRGLMLDTE